MQINRVLMEDKTSLMSGWFQCFYRSLKLVFVEKILPIFPFPRPLDDLPRHPKQGGFQSGPDRVAIFLTD